MSITEENATDVNFLINTVERWRLAIEKYSSINSERQNEETKRINRVDGRIVLNALIDISASMSGTKLIAVKLGLCALLTSLSDDDLMSITAFDDYRHYVLSKDESGERFWKISFLRERLPQLLFGISDRGATAFYDALIGGILDLREFAIRQYKLRPANSDQADLNQTTEGVNDLNLDDRPGLIVNELNSTAPIVSDDKNVVIALTDGEDNQSKRSPQAAYERLINPGINNFMFVLVAVSMSPREESIFRPWMDLRYSKQISVSVRSGKTLVEVFHETLVKRLLETAIGSTRFYQITNSAQAGQDGQSLAGRQEGEDQDNHRDKRQCVENPGVLSIGEDQDVIRPATLSYIEELSSDLRRQDLDIARTHDLTNEAVTANVSSQYLRWAGPATMTMADEEDLEDIHLTRCDSAAVSRCLTPTMPMEGGEMATFNPSSYSPPTVGGNTTNQYDAQNDDDRDSIGSGGSGPFFADNTWHQQLGDPLQVPTYAPTSPDQTQHTHDFHPTMGQDDDNSVASGGSGPFFPAEALQSVPGASNLDVVRSVTPAYQPSSPVYGPSSPAYSPSSPAYSPSSPVYCPSSPNYQPAPAFSAYQSTYVSNNFSGLERCDEEFDRATSSSSRFVGRYNYAPSTHTTSYSQVPMTLTRSHTPPIGLVVDEIDNNGQIFSVGTGLHFPPVMDADQDAESRDSITSQAEDTV